MTPRPPRPQFLISFLSALLIYLLMVRGTLLLAGLPAVREWLAVTPLRLHQLSGAARFAIAAAVVLLFAVAARMAWRALPPGNRSPARWRELGGASAPAPWFFTATLTGAGLVFANQFLEFTYYAALYFFRCRLAMHTLVRVFDFSWLAVGLGGLAYLFLVGTGTPLPRPVHFFWLVALFLTGLRVVPLLT